MLNKCLFVRLLRSRSNGKQHPLKLSNRSILYRFDMVSSSSSIPSAVINPVELPSAARRFKPLIRSFGQAAGKRGSLLKHYGDTPTEQLQMKIDDDAVKVERMQRTI